MKHVFGNLFLVVCLFFFAKGNSQTSFETNETDLYSAFHKFFDAEIRRQGVKLNWIFELEEITGLHTFDIDNDGLKEVLFEFDAVPVEGGGLVNSYAVLFFETSSNKFQLGNYMETPEKRFVSVEGKVFRFYNKEKKEVELFYYQNNRFTKK